MADEANQTGELKFSVDSSLLFQLGEQLVARPSIALAELVKNAYDADATRVKVTMENISRQGGTILLEDDGHGMTFEEMRDSWMRIATSAKRQHSVSRFYCRPMTGAKGIGRFASRRLGNNLTVQSIAERKEGIKESVIAEFDWKHQFRPGDNLTDVPVSYTRKVVPSATPTGVSLLIVDARDAWTQDDISSLRRDLLSLQSPFPDLIVKPAKADEDECLPDPGFDFELFVEDSEKLGKLSGGLGDAFLSAAWARLDGDIDKEGRATYHLQVLGGGETDYLTDESNIYAGLKDTRFRIYFMVYSPRYFAEKDFGVRDAQKKGREEGGVRIYLNGFRVFPYGDKGDDWLQLDMYAAKNIDIAHMIAPPQNVIQLAKSAPGRPYLLIPKNQQVFGAVSITQTEHSDDKPTIELNISRERLIETPVVGGLRRFVLNGIYWMTLKYAAHVAEEQRSRRQQKAQSVPEVIEDAKKAIGALIEVPEERKHAIYLTLDKAAEQAKEEEEERITEVSMLRILASAGTTLTLMNHQLRALIGAVLQVGQDLLRLRHEIPESIHPEYDDIAAQVSEWHEMVELQVSQLGFLLSPDSRQRRRRHALYEIVENVRKPMSYYMKHYKVEFVNEVPKGLRTPAIYESELYSIFINILSNALKAVFGQTHRRIAVEAENVNHTLFVRMKDTGVGLPVQHREISFKPFETRSLPNPVLGVGTGLGLKVVKDILELYAGTARFIDVDKPWKTCIEIVLPEREDAGAS
jgi:signal transduction histidine kinase